MSSPRKAEMSTPELAKISRPNTSEDEFFRMTNFSPEETGLPTYIWISSKASVAEQHGARIKVNQIYGRISRSQFSITLEQPPRVIGQTGELKEKAVKEIIKWVGYNKEELYNVWDGLVDEKRAQFTTLDIIKATEKATKE